jgi:hypothetical protein
MIAGISALGSWNRVACGSFVLMRCHSAGFGGHLGLACLVAFWVDFDWKKMGSQAGGYGCCIVFAVRGGYGALGQSGLAR